MDSVATTNRVAACFFTSIRYIYLAKPNFEIFWREFSWYSWFLITLMININITLVKYSFLYCWTKCSCGLLNYIEWWNMTSACWNDRHYSVTIRRRGYQLNRRNYCFHSWFCQCLSRMYFKVEASLILHYKFLQSGQLWC